MGLEGDLTKPKPLHPEPWGAVLAECDPEQLLTIEQTRGIFGVSRSTIDMWHATQRPPKRTFINDLPRYRVGDVLDLLHAPVPRTHEGSAIDVVGRSAPSQGWFTRWLSRFARKSRVESVVLPTTMAVLLVPVEDRPPRPVPLEHSFFQDIDDRAVLREMTPEAFAAAQSAYAAGQGDSMPPVRQAE